MLTNFPDAISSNAPPSPDIHPAERYLAGLSSADSRRTMRAALNNVAILFSAKPAVRVDHDQFGREKKQDVTYLTCDWASLKPRHIAAIRTKLIKLYSP